MILLNHKLIIAKENSDDLERAIEELRRRSIQSNASHEKIKTCLDKVRKANSLKISNPIVYKSVVQKAEEVFNDLKEEFLNVFN